jgi:hypothetical protein
MKRPSHMAAVMCCGRAAAEKRCAGSRNEKERGKRQAMRSMPQGLSIYIGNGEGG